MDRQQVNEKLKLLHDELNQVELPDSNQQEILKKVASEIQDILARQEDWVEHNSGLTRAGESGGSANRSFSPRSNSADETSRLINWLTWRFRRSVRRQRLTINQLLLLNNCHRTSGLPSHLGRTLLSILWTIFVILVVLWLFGFWIRCWWRYQPDSSLAGRGCDCIDIQLARWPTHCLEKDSSLRYRGIH